MLIIYYRPFDPALFKDRQTNPMKMCVCVCVWIWTWTWTSTVFIIMARLKLINKKLLILIITKNKSIHLGTWMDRFPDQGLLKPIQILMFIYTRKMKTVYLFQPCLKIFNKDILIGNNEMKTYRTKKETFSNNVEC